MTKINFTKCILLLLVLSLTGCDFLRKVAGRPVSEEIEFMRDQIAYEEARAAFVRDSVAAAEKHVADSLAAVEYFASDEAPVKVSVSSLKGLVTTGFDKSYLIVLGSFSQPENAAAFDKKVQQAGYATAVLAYNYGTRIVGVCPTDNLIELRDVLIRLKGESFYPQNAWIMINR